MSDECEEDGGEDNAEVLRKKGSLEQRTYSKTIFFFFLGEHNRSARKESEKYG